ncbi:MAG: hypothetical protein NTZ68_01770 [Candidatus Dependentiae bacterium]|nr:hypothetical protein [Candidatus Dependentiae bacterium]
MSSVLKKQVLLVFGLMASSLSVVASDYQFKRLNGQVMPSTGESKTVTIGMPYIKEDIPLYLFFDYNGQIPLSQRLVISPGHGRVEVTLLPVSKQISVTVVPQADVHKYLNAMESYNAEKMEEKQKEETLISKGGKGVQIIIEKKPVASGRDPVLMQHEDELRKNMIRIANITYEEITDKQIIRLPNPFGINPVDAAPEVAESEVKAEEPEAIEPVTMAQEASVEEPLGQEPLAEQPFAQPEMMQPNVSDIESEDENKSEAEIEDKQASNDETEDESMKANESNEDEFKQNDDFEETSPDEETSTNEAEVDEQ